LFCVEYCRDKVISRFERCRAQFGDLSDMWLAAESSVQLLVHSASDVTRQAATGLESGIGSSTTPHSLSLAQSPQLAEPAASGRETGIDTATSPETADSSETPELKLRRVERLKDHLLKYIQRFKPDQLITQFQCSCEMERW